MSTAVAQRVNGVKPTVREISSPVASGRVPELDGLRGLAILLVIVCHYVNGTDHVSLSLWLRRAISATNIGWSGVDLFFVLSGFLIGGILLDARDSRNYFRTFYLRRVFRILPIYYVWTLLFAVVVIAAVELAPGRLALTLQDLWRVPVQVFFLQNIFIGMPRFTWIWFVVTWSLAVEEQYYLLAPPLIRFLSRRHFVAALAGTVALAPLLRFLLFRYWAPGSYLSSFLMPCRADALACGMLLAVGWREPWFREFVRRNGAALRSALAILLLGVGAMLWWLVHPLNMVTVTIGFSWLAVFYAALLLTVISQTEGWIASIMRWNFLRWLGGVSYCVYLLHNAFNLLGHLIFLHSEPQIYNAGGIAVTLLALAVTFAVASVSWRYFEKPLIRRGHAYSYE